MLTIVTLELFEVRIYDTLKSVMVIFNSQQEWSRLSCHVDQKQEKKRNMLESPIGLKIKLNTNENYTGFKENNAGEKFKYSL